MECLNCDDGKAGVIDCISYAGTVYRRRRCKSCGFEFVTEELEIMDRKDWVKAQNYRKAMYRARVKERNKQNE